MDIKMPKLGESVHEGTIEQWLVSVGDYVEEYEPLCEVITDKVTAEVPSTVAGTITEIVISEGETVEINTVICKIYSPNENNVENTSNDNQQQEKTENTQVNHQDTQSSVQQNSTSKENSDKSKNNGRFSPVVFKLASENQIDLSQVTGTGFEGRVTKKMY